MAYVITGQEDIQTWHAFGTEAVGKGGTWSTRLLFCPEKVLQFYIQQWESH